MRLSWAAAALLAGASASAEQVLTQPQQAYVVILDRPATFNDDGMPVIAPGTVITLKAATPREKFNVTLITPLAFTEFAVDTVWRSTVTKAGGYRIQFGRENQELLSLFDFIVSP